jgi:hypothetical protein
MMAGAPLLGPEVGAGEPAPPESLIEPYKGESCGQFSAQGAPGCGDRGRGAFGTREQAVPPRIADPQTTAASAAADETSQINIAPTARPSVRNTLVARYCWGRIIATSLKHPKPGNRFADANRRANMKCVNNFAHLVPCHARR